MRRASSRHHSTYDMMTRLVGIAISLVAISVAFTIGMLSAMPSASAGETDTRGPSVPLATYGYTGGVQVFTAPYSGTYALEVWGASGGGVARANATVVTTATPALGGFSSGKVDLQQGQSLYVCVGGAGGTGNLTDSQSHFVGAGGYNGGGSPCRPFPSVMAWVHPNRRTESNGNEDGQAREGTLRHDNLHHAHES